MEKAFKKTDKPYFLAIESSGRVGSVALGKGEKIIKELVFTGKMRHSSELFPSLQVLLDKVGCRLNSVGAFFIAVGPGSFTGLRIAVTTAKILNYTQNIPLVAVNTLDVIAENASEYMHETGKNIQKIAVILDAKQNRFYTSIYTKTNYIWEKQLSDTLIKKDAFIKQFGSDPSDPIALLGDGLLYHADSFKADGIFKLPQEYWPAKAKYVLKAGYKLFHESKFSDPCSLVPRYIRPPEAVEKWKKRNA